MLNFLLGNYRICFDTSSNQNPLSLFHWTRIDSQGCSNYTTQSVQNQWLIISSLVTVLTNTNWSATERLCSIWIDPNTNSLSSNVSLINQKRIANTKRYSCSECSCMTMKRKSNKEYDVFCLYLLWNSMPSKPIVYCIWDLVEYQSHPWAEK